MFWGICICVCTSFYPYFAWLSTRLESDVSNKMMWNRYKYYWTYKSSIHRRREFKELFMNCSWRIYDNKIATRKIKQKIFVVWTEKGPIVTRIMVKYKWSSNLWMKSCWAREDSWDKSICNTSWVQVAVEAIKNHPYRRLCNVPTYCIWRKCFLFNDWFILMPNVNG